MTKKASFATISGVVVVKNNCFMPSEIKMNVIIKHCNVIVADDAR